MDSNHDSLDPSHYDAGYSCPSYIDPNHIDGDYYQHPSPNDNYHANTFNEDTNNAGQYLILITVNAGDATYPVDWGE
jgi:hypothetical protein